MLCEVRQREARFFSGIFVSTRAYGPFSHWHQQRSQRAANIFSQLHDNIAGSSLFEQQVASPRGVF